MKRWLCVCASIILALLLNVAGASRSCADSVCDKGSPAGWLYFSSDPYPGYCKLSLEPPVDTVSVWVYAIPFKKARFTVPDPPSGAVIGETWFFPHTGDRASGLELDMGSCNQTGSVKLGEIYVFLSSGVSCTPWSEGVAELQNCAGVWLPAKFIPQRATGDPNACICYGWQYCYSLPPYDLLPLDGAKNVPTNVVLTWVAPEGWDQFNSGCYVYITTDPSCATAQHFLVPCDNDTFAPDFLQPGTTYYWRSSWATDSAWGCAGLAAFQSFTTAVISPVKAATWGRVKSMYRQ